MKFDKQKSIEQKNRIQSTAVKGSIAFKKILLSWATGCGKSLASLKIIQEDLKNNSDLKGYLICKESNHLDNWKDDMKKHNMEFINNSMEMFLYASLHKYSGKKVDFLILDECHGITEKRLNYIKQLVHENTRIIYLSATVESFQKHKLGYHLGGINEYHISIDKAISIGILPHPKLYIHYYNLDDTVRNELVNYKNYGKTNNESNLTQREAYDFITNLMENYRIIWKEEKHEWAKNMWVNLGNNRKRIMSEFKTDIAFQILDTYMKKSRRLIFTGSKKQAELISQYYVHSGNHKDYNMKLKNDFNNGLINELCVVNMFREGMNLFNIEKGLITQLDNVKLSFIQMLGRVFRSDIPEMHIIVFKDTQDEKYLETVLEGFNLDYVTEIYNE